MIMEVHLLNDQAVNNSSFSIALLVTMEHFDKFKSQGCKSDKICKASINEFACSCKVILCEQHTTLINLKPQTSTSYSCIEGKGL